MLLSKRYLGLNCLKYGYFVSNTFHTQMRKIIYYVAVSQDGFISGPGGDNSGFTAAGNGVQKSLRDLKDYDTVIMGKNTYEFGYRFGLKPGENPYPHMSCFVFSDSLKLENKAGSLTVCKPSLEIIDQLKREKGTDIYLCGGGVFAGWLLDNERIDTLKLKINPITLGEGIPIFGPSDKKFTLVLKKRGIYDDFQINEYQIQY